MSFRTRTARQHNWGGVGGLRSDCSNWSIICKKICMCRATEFESRVITFLEEVQESSCSAMQRCVNEEFPHLVLVVQQISHESEKVNFRTPPVLLICITKIIPLTFRRLMSTIVDVPHR